MIRRGEMFDPLLSACPSFRPAWNAFVEEWKDEPELPEYIALGDLALHLVGMLERKEIDGLRRIFVVVEAWHLEGDAYVREAATIGVLESLQNENLHGRSTNPADFVPYLLPETRYWWSKLMDFWEKGKLIVDDRPSREPGETR